MTRRSVLLLGLALLLAACSDSDDAGQGPAPDAANDSQSDTVDTLPDPDVDEDPTSDPDVEEDVVQDVEGDVGVADLGDDSANDVDDMADSADDMADSADDMADSADETTETGDDTGTDMSDVPSCDGTCPGGTPAGGSNTDPDLPSARAQEVIIVAVDFEADRVVLRNVSGGALGANSWQLCQGPGEYAALPALAFAADGDDIVLDLLGNETDTDAEIFLNLSAAVWDLAESDNVAIYRSTGFGDGANMEAYVHWERGGSGDTGRASEANGAGLWPLSSPVEVCATNSGIVAGGGDVTNPSNWSDAADPESCL